MYVALRDLIGNLGTYGPGDPIEEARDWKPHVLRANVSMEYIGGTVPEDYERLHLPVPNVLPKTPQQSKSEQRRRQAAKADGETKRRTTKSANDPLSCGVCGKSFKSARALTCHKTRVGH